MLPRRVRLDADDRREQMIRAAMSVFAVKPYDAISTAELAHAAGTTRTNLNYHFGNKRALYLEALRRFATLPSLLPRGTVSKDREVAVEYLFSRWLDLVERNRETFVALIRAQRTAFDDEVADLFASSLSGWEDRLLAVLGLPDDDVAARAQVRAFQAMVGTATEEWLVSGLLTKKGVCELLSRTLIAIGDLHATQ
ncbi:TetR family transcriptional regulator [Rhodococcoides kyotonense]|uniref:TetR family transcriptional regulator n=1 Tax=Rhodococcoides kyotonense TaxID=398843 RepID=A0A177YL47_9NOCA|nr:TetR family transcriptional regulator [Rhodococcus kyotonensis]